MSASPSLLVCAGPLLMCVMMCGLCVGRTQVLCVRVKAPIDKTNDPLRGPSRLLVVPLLRTVAASCARP